MIKQITRWFKKHATIAKIGALLVFLGIYGEFVRGLQRDIDEVHYSREIIKIEKDHAKEIEEYKVKVNTLREENLNLKMDQFQLMDKTWDKNVNNQLNIEVNDEN